MRYAVEVQGTTHQVEVHEVPGGLEVSIDGGAPRPARLVPDGGGLHTLELGDAREELLVEADPDAPGSLRLALAGRAPLSVEALDARARAIQRQAGAGARKVKQVKSPMPGLILEVRVAPGQAVVKDDVLLILEAMKMQNEIRATADGSVRRVAVEIGASVAAGATLIEFA